jgi:hypothetical protein
MAGSFIMRGASRNAKGMVRNRRQGGAIKYRVDTLRGVQDQGGQIQGVSGEDRSNWVSNITGGPLCFRHQIGVAG